MRGAKRNGGARRGKNGKGRSNGQARPARRKPEPEPQDEPADPRERGLDWLNCRSSRRLYIALHEAGCDVAQLALVLTKLLARFDPQHPAIDHARTAQLVYEGFMGVTSAIGEEIVCELVRSLHPEPPEKIPGYRKRGSSYCRSAAEDRAGNPPSARHRTPGPF